METTDFLNACRGKSIAYKQAAIANLEAGLATKDNGNWNERHCEAVRKLINEITALIVFDMDAKD